MESAERSPDRLSGLRRSSETQASPSFIRLSPSQSSVKRANQAARIQLTDDLLEDVENAVPDVPSVCHPSPSLGALMCANGPARIPPSALPLPFAPETPALVPGAEPQPTNGFTLSLIGSHSIHLAQLLTPMVLGSSSFHGSSVSGTPGASHPAPSGLSSAAASSSTFVPSSLPNSSVVQLTKCFACRAVKVCDRCANRGWILVFYILLGRASNAPPVARICECECAESPMVSPPSWQSTPHRPKLFL